MTLSPRARVSLAVAGGAVLVMVLLFLLWPTVAIDHWPWTLTPLTARTIAAFLALSGVAWVAVALDGRWVAARIPLQCVMLGMALILLAIPRAWDDFDRSDAATGSFVAALVAVLVLQGVLYVAMERRRRSARAPANGIRA